jgi:hypothetical protein
MKKYYIGVKMETNSIKRLLVILRKVLNVKFRGNILEFWREVFDIPQKEGYKEKTFLMFFELRELVKEAKNDISSLEVNHNLYLRHYNNIEQIVEIETLYEQRWEEFRRSKLNNVTMESLEYCLDVLLKHPSENEIKKDDLLWIKEEVDKLTNEVLEKDIEPDLKKVIVSLLESIDLAIIEYKISGIKSFEKLLEQSIGKIILKENLFKNEETKKEVSGLFSIIKKIHDLIKFAKSLTELAEPIIKMLP